MLYFPLNFKVHVQQSQKKLPTRRKPKQSADVTAVDNICGESFSKFGCVNTRYVEVFSHKI